jgi:hypothetical protein
MFSPGRRILIAPLRASSGGRPTHRRVRRVRAEVQMKEFLRHRLSIVLRPNPVREEAVQ